MIYELVLAVHCRAVEGPSNSAQPEMREGQRRMIARYAEAVQVALQREGALDVHVGLEKWPLVQWPQQ